MSIGNQFLSLWNFSTVNVFFVFCFSKWVRRLKNSVFGSMDALNWYSKILTSTWKTNHNEAFSRSPAARSLYSANSKRRPGRKQSFYICSHAGHSEETAWADLWTNYLDQRENFYLFTVFIKMGRLFIFIFLLTGDTLYSKVRRLSDFQLLLTGSILVIQIPNFLLIIIIIIIILL